MKKLFIIFFLISVPLYAMNKPETVAEFIKNQNYYDQKKLYKEKNGEHPLMIVVDDLQQSNKTVQSFVKDFLKMKRKEAEEQLKKDFKISEEQWSKIQNQWNELKQLKNASRNNTIIFDDNICNDMKELVAEIHKDFSLNGELIIYPAEKIRSFWRRLFVLEPLACSASYAKMNNILVPTNKIFVNEKQVRSIGGIKIWGSLAHEMVHLQEHHSFKRDIVSKILERSIFDLAKSKYAHNLEYEADQYAAAKKQVYAGGLELLYKSQRSYLAGFFDHDHPSMEKRYRAVKTIRKLLAYERQWYNGPKGYNKYSEPAYERMWDTYCDSANKAEKQKKLPEYLLMPL